MKELNQNQLLKREEGKRIKAKKKRLLAGKSINKINASIVCLMEKIQKNDWIKGKRLE